MASNEDFQNQLSLMMSKLLHSAVKETSKLFDMTVQNIIAELAQLRKQNDVLKGNIFTDDASSPSKCSKRDVGVQCDAPTTATQVERSCSPMDPTALPPDALQNGQEEFAIVSVKEEEPDTCDETQPTCLFTKILEDQPSQLLVQQRGEASLESSLIPVKLSAFQPSFQATRGHPTVALTHLTSSELTATQQGTPTLRQPKVKVSSTTPQQQGTATSKRKKAAVTWTRHQGTLTLTQPTDAPLALTLSQPKVKVSLTAPQQQGKATLPQKQKGAVTWTRHQGTLTLTQPTDDLTLSSSPPLPVPGSASVEDRDTPAQLEVVLEECDIDAESNTDSQLSRSDLPSTSSRQTRSTYRRVMKSMTPSAREAGSVEEHLPSVINGKSPTGVVIVAEKPHATEEPRQKNQCDVCDRILSSAKALECHRRIHSGERPWVCERCGKGFPDGRGLRRHLLTHKPKRHRCNECGKTFVHAFGLRSHQVTHTSAMEYECKVCGKGFKCKWTLATHMRLHTGEKPFSCSVCFKKFRHRGTYNTHMQRHRGEKRYVCLTCDKSFSDPNNLKAHNRVHTGERPYKCNVCDKKFKQTSHLKKHMATQH
ncbi:zinc finger protein 287-like [Engraulis encrasicolus]|uniref:zinc finger protein 287-like n=1 Tax=Engraulis encrasicolus TaxID=184585 RepID=UPI002FCF96D0